MACGLTVDQLLGFLELYEFICKEQPGGRTRGQKFISHLEHLLTNMSERSSEPMLTTDVYFNCFNLSKCPRVRTAPGSGLEEA